MNIRSKKNKGRRLVKKVKEIIIKFFGFPEESLLINPSGNTGNDIILLEEAKILNLGIEVKNQERLNIWKAIEQVLSNTEKEKIPVVIFSKNHEEIYITLKFETFLDIYREFVYRKR